MQLQVDLNSVLLIVHNLKAEEDWGLSVWTLAARAVCDLLTRSGLEHTNPLPRSFWFLQPYLRKSRRSPAHDTQRLTFLLRRHMTFKVCPCRFPPPHRDMPVSNTPNEECLPKSNLKVVSLRYLMRNYQRSIGGRQGLNVPADTFVMKGCLLVFFHPCVVTSRAVLREFWCFLELEGQSELCCR